jgi:hypothetical protein
MDDGHRKFVDFIEKVKEMDYHDIMEVGDREVEEMESRLRSASGADMEMFMEGKEYTDQIKAFLSFMRHGIRPQGVSAYDFRLYRIVVEYLVAKGQMKPEAVEAFISSK